MNQFTKMFKGVIKSIDEKTHRATVLISTGDIDRDQEIIEPKAFQKRLGNYMAHPVLLSSHKADALTRQIGEAHALRITDQGVEGDYEWYVGKGNPEADWGWFLVTRGVAAFSVGFMAHAWVDKFTQPMISAEDTARGVQRRFTEIELLENSQVLVPCNQNALQRRMAEADGQEKELLELVVKSVKTEEMEKFDRPAETLDLLRAKVHAQEDIIKAHQETIEVLAKEIADLKEALAKFTPKHYSEVLLGAGGHDPKLTPAKEADGKAKGQPKQQDILGAVRSGVKEGCKR